MKTRNRTFGRKRHPVYDVTPEQFAEALAYVVFRHLPRHVIRRAVQSAKTRKGIR